MLLGRAAEQEQVEAILAGASRGRGGCLVIRGEPGIGKSALLAYARSAADADMQVLTARAMQIEAELPFAGLAELLAPVLDRLDRLPEPQEAALRSALALGPAVPGDRFAAYAATLSLLSATAEAGPVLAVIDDAHWLDTASAEALRFTAHRLDHEPVALLFAARNTEPVVFEAPDLELFDLEGLDVDACRSLVEQEAGREIPAGVAGELRQATAGNPLALAELPRLLTAEQLSGIEPLLQPLPVSGTLEEVYRRRIAAFHHSTRRALAVAAASDSGEITGVQGALERLGGELAALDSAEAAGVVSLSHSTVEFRHPLLRSAAYQFVDAPERRAVHAALAETIADTGSSSRRALHRAAAAIGPDEDVATELERAAAESRKRGAPAAAAHAMEDSAELTPQPSRRAARLRAAGHDAYVAGQLTRADALLVRALECAGSADRAAVQHLRGRIEMLSGSTGAARDLMLEAAAAAEPVDPAQAVVMLAEAEGTLVMEGNGPAARAAAERAYALGERVGGPSAMVGALVLGGALGFSGESEGARRLLARAEPLIVAAGLQKSLWLSASYAEYLSWVEEEEKAARLVAEVVKRARAAGVVGLLPWALTVACDLQGRLGNWSEAYALGSESMRLSEETGQRTAGIAGLGALARAEAVQGREQACRDHLRAALQVAQATGARAVDCRGHNVLGFLDLGLGRPDEAIPPLERGRRLEAEDGLKQPNVTLAGPDLVEAYARSGRPDDAREALADLERQAAYAGSRWAACGAARCRGLLCDDDAIDGAFGRALELHEQTPSPFERARTQLCFGERLRRARRPSEGRTWLHKAHEAFERGGASAWAARAERELSASGERPTAKRAGFSGYLTPQELQVALVVADGATNREAAAALFISPRTVEAHLNRIYRKLDLKSRAQLTRLVVEERVAGPDADTDAKLEQPAAGAV